MAWGRKRDKTPPVDWVVERVIDAYQHELATGTTPASALSHAIRETVAGGDIHVHGLHQTMWAADALRSVRGGDNTELTARFVQALHAADLLSGLADPEYGEMACW